MAWWLWPLFLFVFTLVIGIIAPISGIGGGSIFVPFAALLFPFNIDFIRGTGIVLAVVTASISVPYLIRKGLASLRIFAVIAPVIVITSTIGGWVGLWVTNAYPSGKYIIKLLLGVIMVLIFLVMAFSKRVEFPVVKEEDRDFLSRKLNIWGEYYEPNLDAIVEYTTKNTPLSIAVFAVIGFIAGMFGLGAGWANVPLLNLVMGVPIKVATATSMLIITANAPAVGVYLTKGTILPFIVVPAILGITIGARIGAKLAEVVKPKSARWLVMIIIIVAGVLNIVKGLQGMHVIPHILPGV